MNHSSSVGQTDLHFRAIFVAVFLIVDDGLPRPGIALKGVLISLGDPFLLSIIGSRMFFNLKEAAEHGVNVGTNWSSYSHSAIHFVEQQVGEDQEQ